LAAEEDENILVGMNSDSADKNAPVHEYLILPGYGNSGPKHWQTLWEGSNPGFRRVNQREWENPVREIWVETLEKAVAGSGPGLVLVAHSLACLLVAHWAATAPSPSLSRIQAALLVSPVDPTGPIFPASAVGFAPAPMALLPFPTLIVASSDDPYGGPEFSRACAKAWGSRVEEVGAKGHINSESGLGNWPEGFALLQSLSGR
jgi:predicted alpha/beta hydrolase family esterase